MCRECSPICECCPAPKLGRLLFPRDLLAIHLDLRHQAEAELKLEKLGFITPLLSLLLRGFSSTMNGKAASLTQPQKHWQREPDKNAEFPEMGCGRKVAAGECSFFLIPGYPNLTIHRTSRWSRGLRYVAARLSLPAVDFPRRRP